ncbi:MAG: SET domain-containing protein, partial [Methanothrix sp.]
DGTYLSEIYTEGEGYWTLQGAKIENNLECLKGHLRHSPLGTMEMHSATPVAAQEDNIGHRVKVYAPDDTAADEHGLIAAELINLEKKAVVRIYKDGAVRVTASTDITGESAKSEVLLEVDGHCWLRNAVADACVEIFPDGQIKIKSLRIVLEGDVEITGDLTVGGIFSAPLSGDV